MSKRGSSESDGLLSKRPRPSDLSVYGSNNASVQKESQDALSENLHAAILKRDADMVKLHVRNGADPNRGWKDPLPLMVAAGHGYTDIIRCLLSLGARVDERGPIYGMTALIFASAKGKANAIECLKDEGADLELRTDTGKTALVMAATYGHVEATRVLLKRGATIKFKHCRICPHVLIVAVSEGHVEIVDLLLKAGVDTEVWEWDTMWTPLMFAASLGRSDMIRKLCVHGAHVEARELMRRTALMIAAKCDHVSATRALLDAGANPDAVDEKNQTALYMAASFGHVKVLDELLAYDASTTITTLKTQRHALSIAGMKGHVDAIRCLVKSGLDVNLVSGTSQRTAIIDSAEEGMVLAIRCLVQLGADYDHQDFKGNTALIFAAENSRIEAVKCLVELGAAIDHHNRSGKTALFIATSNGDLDVIQYLLVKGCMVNGSRRMHLRQTPLHIAARHGWIDIIECLLNHGADLKACDYYGNTALHYVAKHYSWQQADTIRILVDAGLDINTCNCCRQTAFMVAISNRVSKDIILEFLRCGANPFSISLLQQARYVGNFPEDKTVTALILDSQKPWSPEGHYLFPRHFAQRISFLMMMADRLSQRYPKLVIGVWIDSVFPCLSRMQVIRA